AGATREGELPLAGAEHRDPIDPVELGDLVGQAHLLQVADRARATPHLAVAAGAVGAASGMPPEHTALSVIYTTMTGSATAAQRLLALDPGDVAAVTFDLAPLCDQLATEAAKGLCELSDPLLDVLAERHSQRERPLFAS
ncbi:urease accessory UreF family protein, partial [Mycolicibacterium elephantis]|uniref:urease accessory UreF family protein n=1 Tax=Mycolicibacterium elephantis TaxID=81858 RepID=UPI003A86A76F